MFILLYFFLGLFFFISYLLHFILHFGFYYFLPNFFCYSFNNVVFSRLIFCNYSGIAAICPVILFPTFSACLTKCCTLLRQVLLSTVSISCFIIFISWLVVLSALHTFIAFLGVKSAPFLRRVSRILSLCIPSTSLYKINPSLTTPNSHVDGKFLNCVMYASVVSSCCWFLM